MFQILNPRFQSLTDTAGQYKSHYQSAKPFPNIYIDGGIKLGAVILLVGSLLFILLSGTDKLYIRNFLTGKKITAT